MDNSSSLLHESSFGTLCLGATWTSHHVHFRLLNLLACRTPPPPQQGNSPLLRSHSLLNVQLKTVLLVLRPV